MTDCVKIAVEKADIKDYLVSVFSQGTTTDIMINENWDESVQDCNREPCGRFRELMDVLRPPADINADIRKTDRQ
ncbi:MAG: YjbQ family protein [Fibrobacteraceae bacterium]|nr:YjbQ family protein [Fibrobacteraceae bacterium]